MSGTVDEPCHVERDAVPEHSTEEEGSPELLTPEYPWNQSRNEDAGREHQRQVIPGRQEIRW